jgi:hypothetical protein
MVLRERLDEVAPDGQERSALQCALVSLRERDRLALVIGAVVPQQQVEQVHGEQRIARGASVDRRSALVAYKARSQPPQSSGIGRVFIRADRDRIGPRRCQANQLGDVALECLGIGAAMACFEEGTSSLLRRGHPPLAAQLGERKCIHEVRLGSHRTVEMERVVLAIGEALEAIDHERLAQPTWPVLVEKEQGMTSQSRGLAHDRGRVTPRLTGDLAVARATQEPIEDRLEQRGTLEVVGGGEALTTESRAAVSTAEPRYGPR